MGYGGSRLSSLPFLGRVVLAVAFVAATVGGTAGLIIGLLAYPPTAAFAVFELAVPAAITGALVGLLGGLGVLIGRKQLHRQ